MKIKTLALSLNVLLLAACGGSGSDNSAATDPAPNPNSGTAPVNDPLPTLTPEEETAFEQSLVEVRHKVMIAASPTQPLGNHTVFHANGKDVLTRTLTSPQPGVFQETTTLNFANLARGLHDHGYSQDDGSTHTGIMRSYKGFYGGNALFTNNIGSQDWIDYGIGAVDIPTAGHAEYTGLAFDQNHKGMLRYHIDFANKKGHGQISDLGNYGVITLNPADIAKQTWDYSSHDAPNTFIYQTHAGEGSANAENGEKLSYRVQLFGNQAQEIGGTVMYGSDGHILFYGARGEITP